MDYLLPTACDIPRIEIEHLETVPLDADVNFRGVGEGGMIVAPPTVVNAIEDALAPFGVRIYEQHLPPARILELIAAANAGLPRHAEAKEVNEEPSGFQDGVQRLERFQALAPCELVFRFRPS
jgi:hypothetical protein